MQGSLPALKAIVAVCDDWGIGENNKLLVANKADMRHFVACTKGHTVVMGRKTLDSFPGGRPLPNRRNVVLTRDPSFEREGAVAVRSIDELAEAVARDDEVWVVGGDSVYRQLLPYCDTVVVTKNHCVRPADAFFPNLDEDHAWAADDCEATGTTDEGVPYEFLTYRRVALA